MINERAFYVDDDKVGYVNSAGQKIIVAQFDSVIPYWTCGSDYGSDHFTVVRFGEQYGVVDQGGKYVINPQFEGLAGFSLEY